MPFKSDKQRGWMYKNKPDLAKEFEAATKQKDAETNERYALTGHKADIEPTDAEKEQYTLTGHYAEGGEVKDDSDDNGTLAGLRDLMRKHAAGENIHETPKEDFMVNSSTKNYAGGGMVHKLIDPMGIPPAASDVLHMPPQPMAQQPQAIPPLSATTAALDQTPDTNYDFYGNVGADQRKALYDQLLQKQTSTGNMVAQAAGGIGDAISNSFGGQHNKFQDETRGIAEQNTAARIGAVDTQRQQKLQDMQGNQEMIMNDPKHPIAAAMRSTLKGFGVNVPSGMPAGIMLKVAGPMGELALKQATVAIQQGQAAESVRHNKVDEANTATGHTNTLQKQEADIADKQIARKEEAAKGLQSRPWYQKGFEAVPFLPDSDATKAMREELKQPSAKSAAAPSVLTATNSMGHKITSKDGGQTWE